MATLQGSILNMQTILATVKQYGDLQDLDGFKFTNLSNENTRTVFALFMKKLIQNISALQKSQELIDNIHSSRMSEIRFIFIFGVIICVLVICSLLYAFYQLIIPHNICEDDGYDGADVNALKKQAEPYDCRVFKTSKERKINKQIRDLASELHGASIKYDETLKNFVQKNTQQGGALFSKDDSDFLLGLVREMNELNTKVQESINTIENIDDTLMDAFENLKKHAEEMTKQNKQIETIVKDIVNDMKFDNIGTLRAKIKDCIDESNQVTQYTNVIITFYNEKQDVEKINMLQGVYKALTEQHNFSNQIIPKITKRFSTSVLNKLGSALTTSVTDFFDKGNPIKKKKGKNVKNTENGQESGEAEKETNYDLALQEEEEKEKEEEEKTKKDTIKKEAGDIYNKTNLKLLKDEKEEADNKQMNAVGNISVSKGNIENVVKFNFWKGHVMGLMSVISVLIIFILFLIMVIKWYATQRRNANNSLKIDFVEQFDAINKKLSIQLIADTCVDCLSHDDGFVAFMDEIPPPFLTALKDIYDNIEMLSDFLEKIDVVFMMTEVDKAALAIDSFLSKADDEVEGIKTLDAKEKLSIINNLVVPMFRVNLLKVDGVYFNSQNSTDISGVFKANIVCQSIVTTTTSPTSVLKDFADAGKQLIDEIISRMKDVKLKFIFANLILSAQTIYLQYLFIDRIKDFNDNTFNNMRRFIVIQKGKDTDMSDPLLSPVYTWFAQDVIENSKIDFVAEIEPNKRFCKDVFAEKQINQESSGEPSEDISDCFFFLDIFSPGVSSISFHETNPLMEVIINNQPFAQLNSYNAFQSIIVDALFGILQENNFPFSLGEFVDDIMLGIEKYDKSPLVSNELRECFANIINDTDLKVEATRTLKTATDEFISFDRFKIKYSELTCYESSKTFGMNLLIMKSYGDVMKNIFQKRDVYFPNERLKVDLFEKLVIFIIIILSAWYIYFVVVESWKTVKLRHIIKKIEFLLNFGMSDGNLEHDQKPPSLQFETNLEKGRVMLNWIGLKMCVVGFILMMFFAVLYANSRKSQNILNYNYNIVMMNTQRILTGVDNALFHISKPSNNNPNTYTLGFHYLNTLLTSSKGNNVSPLLTSTEQVRVVERTLTNNKDMMTMVVKLNSDDRELKIIYDSLVDMLLSYKNENSILMSRKLGLMFPYIDIVTNGILLFVALVMMLLIIFKLNPFDMVNMARQYNIAIHNEDVNIIECMLQNEEKFDETNNIIIISCIVVILVFVVIMNITKVVNSGSNYDIMLYNSSLYTNRMGYNMKV